MYRTDTHKAVFVTLMEEGIDGGNTKASCVRTESLWHLL